MHELSPFFRQTRHRQRGKRLVRFIASTHILVCPLLPLVLEQFYILQKSRCRFLRSIWKLERGNPRIWVDACEKLQFLIYSLCSIQYFGFRVSAQHVLIARTRVPTRNGDYDNDTPRTKPVIILHSHF